MKRRLLLPIILCLLSAPMLFAQISNTETNITLSSINFLPSQVCPWNNVPSSSAGNVYQMYIEFEDGDNFGVNKRLPATGYYNCTVTNTPNAYGPDISIDVPGANFPTVNNTSLLWDLVQTKGSVYLVNTTTSATYYQIWEYDQYRCPALPIYISSFTCTQFSDRLKFDWTAIDESDYLSHYILQKSYNNFHWFDEVFEPANTGLGTHNYTVHANKPGNNNVRYRLKWIGEYGFARTTQSIQVLNSGTTATNIVCNYANITGPTPLCAPASAVYKLHNAPASGGPYSWTAGGGSVSSTEQNGLKANISFSSPSNATVYANSANSSCNKSNAVTVGGTGNVTIYGNYTAHTFYTYYTLSINNLWPGTTGSQYEWYSDGNYVGSGQSWNFFVYPGTCQSIEVKVNTSCGLVTGFNYLCYVEPEPCDPWCEPCEPCDLRIAGGDKFKVMPVPANDVLTISMAPDKSQNLTEVKPGRAATASNIYTIQLYDMFGNLRLERKNVSLKTDQRLDVRHLPVGNYVLYIMNAKNKISKQVRIQR